MPAPETPPGLTKDDVRAVVAEMVGEGPPSGGWVLMSVNAQGLPVCHGLWAERAPAEAAGDGLGVPWVCVRAEVRR